MSKVTELLQEVCRFLLNSYSSTILNLYVYFSFGDSISGNSVLRRRSQSSDIAHRFAESFHPKQTFSMLKYSAMDATSTVEQKIFYLIWSRFWSIPDFT